MITAVRQQAHRYRLGLGSIGTKGRRGLAGQGQTFREILTSATQPFSGNGARQRFGTCRFVAAVARALLFRRDYFSSRPNRPRCQAAPPAIHPQFTRAHPCHVQGGVSSRPPGSFQHPLELSPSADLTSSICRHIYALFGRHSQGSGRFHGNRQIHAFAANESELLGMVSKTLRRSD